MGWVVDKFSNRSKAHPVRRLVREFLAATFWLHSLFLFNFLGLQRLHSIDAPRYAYNGALICFIFYFSFFSNRGWLSVLWDLLFVYIYPLVIIRRILWWSTKVLLVFIIQNAKATPSAEGTSEAASANLKTAIIEQSPSEVALSKQSSTLRPTTAQRLLLPFRQFVILWSILLLTVYNRYFIAVVTLITLFGVGKALWNLHAIFADTAQWTLTLKSNLAGEIEKKLIEVRSWEEGTDYSGVRSSANTLKIWEIAFGFLNTNRVFLAKCTWAGAVLISIPFYAYISFLFSCIYVGLARFQGVTFSFASAFIDALYIPFAFTDLPHLSMLRFVAGLHCVALSLLGWNLVTKHFSSRFDDLVRMAVELRPPLQEDDLKRRLRVIEDAVAATSKNK